MKKLVIKYPWSQLEKGQGFFVPCLDIKQTKEEGLKAAVSVRVFDAKTKAGVIAGKYGILFFRAPLNNSAQF